MENVTLIREDCHSAKSNVPENLHKRFTDLMKLIAQDISAHI